MAGQMLASHLAAASDAASEACAALRDLIEAQAEPASSNQALLLAAASAAATAAAASASAAALLVAQLGFQADSQAASQEQSEHVSQQQQQQQQQAARESTGATEPVAGPRAESTAPAGTVAAAQKQLQAGLTVITGGAAQLQGCLDEMEAGQPAVVSWHAPWCQPCLEAERQLAALAEECPGAACFVLDVEGSAANTALALQKVMGRPESRRPGAKPVLKSGHKWPCLTLHWAPSPGLQIADAFYGQEAVQQVAHALREQAPLPSASAGAGSSLQQPASGPAAASEPEVAMAEPKCAQVEPAGSAAVLASPAPACAGAVELQQGAAEFKQLLLAGQAAGKRVVVVWTQGQSEACAGVRLAAQQAVSTSSGDLDAKLVLADTNASKANERLAEAFGIKSFPAILVYRGMKQEQRLAGPDATPAALLVALHMQPPGNSTAGPAGKDATQQEAAGQAGTSAGAEAEAESEEEMEDPFAPPSGKFARKGAMKRLPDGRMAEFYPKMPCLRCGCPWWDGDDWDSRCLRCGWDCEQTGYDDDSQPLPQHRKRWEAFVASIAAGKTPPYTPATPK